MKGHICNVVKGHICNVVKEWKRNISFANAPP